MSKDTIYRQDAADAINELHDKPNAWLDLAVEALEKLPSAEPERKLELHGDESAIEILSELRSWFSCFDEKEGLAYHALSLAIKEIKERKKGRWIDDTYCSECGWINRVEPGFIGSVSHYNFCPNCGSFNAGEQE